MRSEAIQPLWVTGRGGGGRTHARKVVGPVARATGRYLVRARAHRVTPHRHVDRVGLRRESGPAQPGGPGGTCQPSRAGGGVLGGDVLRRPPRSAAPAPAGHAAATVAPVPGSRPVTGRDGLAGPE